MHSLQVLRHEVGYPRVISKEELRLGTSLWLVSASVRECDCEPGSGTAWPDWRIAAGPAWAADILEDDAVRRSGRSWENRSL